MVAPLTFFEVQREVDLHAVELGQPAFGKAPERFDAVDVSTTGGEGLFLVDADVLVITNVDESIVAGPAIRADHAAGINAPTDDGSQSVLAAIIHDFGVNFSLPLEDAKDRLFERATSSPSGQSASSHPAGTEVAFIDFDHPAKLPPLVHALPGNEQAEALVESIDGVTVEPQKCRRLGGSQVQGETLHDFSDLVLA